MALSLDQAMTLVGDLVSVGTAIANLIVQAIQSIRESKNIQEQDKAVLIEKLTAALDLTNSRVQTEPVYDPATQTTDPAPVVHPPGETVSKT